MGEQEMGPDEIAGKPADRTVVGMLASTVLLVGGLILPVAVQTGLGPNGPWAMHFSVLDIVSVVRRYGGDSIALFAFATLIAFPLIILAIDACTTLLKHSEVSVWLSKYRSLLSHFSLPPVLVASILLFSVSAADQTRLTAGLGLWLLLAYYAGPYVLNRITSIRITQVGPLYSTFRRDVLCKLTIASLSLFALSLCVPFATLGLHGILVTGKTVVGTIYLSWKSKLYIASLAIFILSLCLPLFKFTALALGLRGHVGRVSNILLLLKEWAPWTLIDVVAALVLSVKSSDAYGVSVVPSQGLWLFLISSLGSSAVLMSLHPIGPAPDAPLKQAVAPEMLHPVAKKSIFRKPIIALVVCAVLVAATRSVWETRLLPEAYWSMSSLVEEFERLRASDREDNDFDELRLLYTITLKGRMGSQADRTAAGQAVVSALTSHSSEFVRDLACSSAYKLNITNACDLLNQRLEYLLNKKLTRGDEFSHSRHLQYARDASDACGCMHTGRKAEPAKKD